MKTEGYKVQEYHGPVKRYCQTMDLRDNAELIRKYKEAHDRDHFWDEIKQGIRSVASRGSLAAGLSGDEAAEALAGASTGAMVSSSLPRKQ